VTEEVQALSMTRCAPLTKSYSHICKGWEIIATNARIQGHNEKRKSPVTPVHCGHYTVGDKKQRCLARPDDSFVHHLPLVGLERRKHIVRLSAPRKITPYAQPQSGKCVGPQLVYYILDAIVASRASTLPEANPSRRKADIIVDNQDVARLEVVTAHQRENGPAASIHEGHRLGKRKGPTLETTGPAKDISLFVREGDIPFPRDGVDYFEADVVTGSFIVGPGITEPDYQSSG
jgi:hypothetical protein